MVALQAQCIEGPLAGPLRGHRLTAWPSQRPALPVLWQTGLAQQALWLTPGVCDRESGLARGGAFARRPPLKSALDRALEARPEQHEAAH